MEASIEQGIAWQIRINRELRGMTQRQLAQILGTKQSAISRLEDPTYGAHSLETLIGIAKAFDCALSVKLVAYSQLAYDSERLGEADQCATPYSLEMEEIDEQQKGRERIASHVADECSSDNLRRPTSRHASGALRK